MESFVETLGALLRDGDGRRAFELAEEQGASDPVRRHVGLAVVAAHRNDAGATLTHARAAYELAPEEPVVLQQMAVAHLLRGDGDGAEHYARRAVNRDDGLRSRRGLANILLNLGRWDEAEAAYQAVMELEPDDVPALNGLGTVRFRRGDMPGALRWYARAFAIAPGDPDALRSITTMYREAGWALGAITLARITRGGEHPDDVSVALDMVSLLLSARFAAGIPARELVPGYDLIPTGLVERSAGLSPAVQLQAARALFDTGHLDAMRAVVRRVSGSAPSLSAEDRGQLDYLRGLLSEQDGDPEEALEHYTAAVTADSSRWDACCNAITLNLQREDAAAYEAVEGLLAAVDPELRRFRPQLIFNEAVYLKNVRRLDAARAAIERLMAITGGAGDVSRLAQEVLAEIAEIEARR